MITQEQYKELEFEIYDERVSYSHIKNLDNEYADPWRRLISIHISEYDLVPERLIIDLIYKYYKDGRQLEKTVFDGKCDTIEFLKQILEAVC